MSSESPNALANANKLSKTYQELSDFSAHQLAECVLAGNKQLNALSNAIKETMSLYTESAQALNQTIFQTMHDISLMSSSMSDSMADVLRDSDIFEYLRQYSQDVLKNTTRITAESFQNMIQTTIKTVHLPADFDESDYVIVNRKIAEKYCMTKVSSTSPDNTPIKLDTSNLLALIAIILETLFFILGQSSSAKEQASTEEFRQTVIELLREILDNSDCSCSSEASTFLLLQNSLEVSYSDCPDHSELPDTNRM